MSEAKKQTIRRADHTVDLFYRSARATAQDKQISYDALGMLNYLLSKPDYWKVQPHDLERLACGRNKVYRILKELISSGYITRIIHKDDKGRTKEVEYIVYEVKQPLSENQEVDNQEVENGDSRYKREEKTKEVEESAPKKKPVKTTRTPEQIAQDEIAQAWFDAVGGFGTAPTYYRKEAALLIEQGATAELVALMAAERNTGREDTYKLAWLVEDWPEWNAQRERRAREQNEIERQRRIADQERAWRREILGGAV